MNPTANPTHLHLNDPKPMEIVGAGRLIATIWKLGGEHTAWRYRFNLVRQTSDSEIISNLFQPTDLMHFIKLIQVLAAVIADDGCLTQGYVSDNDLPGEMLMHNIATLDAIEHLQDRLLAGDLSHLDERSPNTVNSVVRVVMALLRFCFTRKWIAAMPHVEKLDTDEVMKGRPISEAEFQQMLDSTESVVAASAAASWKFALQILWGSAFRIGDLMDFSWKDPRHIHPVWGRSQDDHPTLAIPSSQKNGKTQEIPMLPELAELLLSIPEGQRSAWVANPEPVAFDCSGAEESFRPSSADLKQLSKEFRTSAIAAACSVSAASVRRWRQHEAKF